MNEIEKRREKYLALQSAHKCVKCGQKLRGDYFYVMCPKCRKTASRNTQKWRKAHPDYWKKWKYKRTIIPGICKDCGATITTEYQRCADCRARASLRTAEKRAAHREEYNAQQRIYAKDLYQRRKQNHLCARCGKKLPLDYSKVNCFSCLEKDRQKRLSQCDYSKDTICGCVRCGEPRYKWYKVCKKHFDINMANLAKVKNVEAVKQARRRYADNANLIFKVR